MVPCVKETTIDNISMRVAECEREIALVNQKVGNMEASIQSIEKSIQAITKKLDNAQTWFITLLLAIVGTFLYERLF